MREQAVIWMNACDISINPSVVPDFAGKEFELVEYIVSLKNINCVQIVPKILTCFLFQD